MELHVDAEQRYAIRGPEQDRRHVEFWTARRLSYDNKREWEKALVVELADRLLDLADTQPKGPGEPGWLRAVFASDDPIDCDAGNLTYLNVGTRPFATLGHRISFERWYEVPDAPCAIAWETSHRYYHRSC